MGHTMANAFRGRSFRRAIERRARPLPSRTDFSIANFPQAERAMNADFSASSIAPSHGRRIRPVPFAPEHSQQEIDMRWKQGTVIGLLGLSMICGAFAPASAETRWERHHPRAIR